MPRFRTNHPGRAETYDGKHRFEHWYRDNSIYFITARCRQQVHAFATEQAKNIFWDRFDHWTRKYQFVPIITSLLDNHYHTLGYLRVGTSLGPMMQKLHGSVSKQVNDTLPVRHLPFWRDNSNHDYFDGCVRDVLQMRRPYGYTLRQGVRHRVATRWEDYAHTRVQVGLEPAVRRAVELKAFLEAVPYARYERRSRGRPR